MITTKLILLIYLAGTYAWSNSKAIPWVVLALLIYFCMNILYYIFKNEAIKKVLLLITILAILLSAHFVYSFLILLFPLNLFELAAYFTQKKWLLIILALIPDFFIKEELLTNYSLITFFCFVIYSMARHYNERIKKYEEQTDKLRKMGQNLSKRLNENKEYMRQSEYTYKLEERNRLSQEIHDKIGHSMTGALIQMEAAKHIVATDKEQAVNLLQNAINISKDGIEEIRLTLKNIKPPAELMGVSRIKLYIEEFASKHGIKVPFTFNGNLDNITPIQWKVIRENLGEALTNALKYADATVVSIEIQVLNKFVKMEVKDNGKGSPKIKKGLGIAGMEERTAALNGTIIVDGSNGFSVTTLLPVE